MPSANPFVNIADRYADLPPRLRRPLVTRAVGKSIPFVDTAACFVYAYTPTRVSVHLDNRRAVQNHLGGLHAAALALLAETASGLVVALNVPPESAPVLQTMDVEYGQFAQTSARAEAQMTDEESDRIQSRPVGRANVKVQLRAPHSGDSLATSRLEWAWLPKERLSNGE